MALTEAAGKLLQRRLNTFTTKYLRGVDPIEVDGEVGPETRARIKLVKRYLGYGKTDATVKPQFINRLQHPHTLKFFGTKMLARSFARRRKQRKDAGTDLGVRALRVAQTYVGIMEHGGNNMGAAVTKIIRANGGTGPEPWCGDAVADWFRKAGSKSVTRAWAMAWCTGGRRRVTTPKPGDIVEYTFQHTGIVEKVLGGGKIQVIEGNTGPSGAVSDSSTGGDGVYRKIRSTSLVRGYYRVSR